MENLPPISGWQDVAAIVSLVTAPLIALSLFAAFRQIKAQADISRRELSFNGLIEFNNKFERQSNAYQSVRERFANNDYSVNHETVKQVFNGYWRLVHEEFEFFKDGLIPIDIFTGWMLLAYAQIAGETSLSYFAKDGSIQKLGSRERFEKVVMSGRYQHHPKFCAFMTGLFQLKVAGMDGNIIPEHLRYAAVSRYIKNYAKRLRSKLV
jgi:hypothetical protein